MAIAVFDERKCSLGEGAFWHPEREQLFWFDINAKQLLTQGAKGPCHWQFEEHVSAAGWVEKAILLVASSKALIRLNIETGDQTVICELEADIEATRSNDGRADPWGGFWIGTMGKQAQAGAGSIYRFYKGKLTKLYDRLTIPNAICFSPDRNFVYYTDSAEKIIMRQSLDENGWPDGFATPFIDGRNEGLGPDGAVVDQEGYLWNAQWGNSRVARYAPDGTFTSSLSLPATQVSCPAFGGSDLTTLFVTTAYENLAKPSKFDGQTFFDEVDVVGQKEHQVKL